MSIYSVIKIVTIILFISMFCIAVIGLIVKAEWCIWYFVFCLPVVYVLNFFKHDPNDGSDY
jgi:hypothetical protein